MNKSKSAIVFSTIIEKIQLILGIFLAVIFGACTIASFVEPILGANGFLVFCIIVDAISVVLIVFSRKRHNLIRDFKSYVAQLSNDPTGSIENLAASSGTSIDVVKKNLQKMIDRKYFCNATIDHSSNCIVLPNRKETQTFSTPSSTQFSTPIVTTTSNGNTTTQQFQRIVTTSSNVSGFTEEDEAEFNEAFAEFNEAFAGFNEKFAGFNNVSVPTNSSAPEIVSITCKGCGGISTLKRGQTGECEYCGSTIQG